MIYVAAVIAYILMGYTYGRYWFVVKFDREGDAEGAAVLMAALWPITLAMHVTVVIVSFICGKLSFIDDAYVAYLEKLR